MMKETQKMLRESSMIKIWVDLRLPYNGPSAVVAMIQRSLDLLHAVILP